MEKEDAFWGAYFGALTSLGIAICIIWFANWVNEVPSKKEVLKSICIEKSIKEACEAL